MDGVKRYWVPCGVLADQSGWHPDDNEVVLAGEHDVAMAALREELARVKGLDHNQLLAESAAQHLIKRGAENYTGEVFTIQLDDSTTKFEVVVSTQKVGAITVYERLAAAEQRNADVEKRAADLIECLWGIELPGAGNPRLRKLRRALEALKPTESGASE